MLNPFAFANKPTAAAPAPNPFGTPRTALPTPAPFSFPTAAPRTAVPTPAPFSFPTATLTPSPFAKPAAAAVPLAPTPFPSFSPAAPVPAAQPHATVPCTPPPAFSTAAAASLATVVDVSTAVTAATTPDPVETAARAEQTALFTPAVRRDVYAILLNPNDPGVAPSAPSAAAAAAAAAGRIPFEVSLLVAKASTKSCTLATAPPALDTFAFVARPTPAQSLPPGWAAVEDATLLDAVAHLGEADPLPLAVTKAFEAFLAARVKGWGEAQAARLSIGFLVAFALELTPRLDAHHRIRSSQLSEDELATLRAPPYPAFVDSRTLAVFQGVRPPPTLAPVPTLTLKSPSQILAPRPAEPSTAPHAPDSPARTSTPLPLPPPPLASRAPATTTAQLLFTNVTQ